MVISSTLRYRFAGLGLSLLMAAPAHALVFAVGDIVISTVSGSTLDAASPITLQQFGLNAGGTVATAAGTLVLPQTASGANSAISGEYGSASEGFLQRSVDGKLLTIAGYGVNAQTFNAAPLATYGNAALGQTTSLTGQPVTTVPRVVATIGAGGTVDTTTQLTGVFNTNNPRSAGTIDGTSFYVTGQGSGSDTTGGVFYATKGATTATPINTSLAGTNPYNKTGSNTNTATVGTEARDAQLVTDSAGVTSLVVSRDFKANGTPNSTADLRTLTNATGGLPTSATGLQAARVAPDVLSKTGANYGSIELTATLTNGVNTPRFTTAGNHFVYVSPERFFFADDNTLYIADSGAPKSGSADAAGYGEGGLQKWARNPSTGVWSIVYDLVNGLNLVDNATKNANTPTAAGVTGLFGLTGAVVNGSVELFATSFGLNELSNSFLYEVTDSLANVDPSVASIEAFTTLYAAPSGTSIRGVAFASAEIGINVPEPASMALLASMFGAASLVRRRR